MFDCCSLQEVWSLFKNNFQENTLSKAFQTWPSFHLSLHFPERSSLPQNRSNRSRALLSGDPSCGYCHNHNHRCVVIISIIIIIVYHNCIVHTYLILIAKTINGVSVNAFSSERNFTHRVYFYTFTLLRTVCTFKHGVYFYTQCVIFNIVCNFIQTVDFYTQCVLLHTVCTFTHSV